MSFSIRDRATAFALLSFAAFAAVRIVALMRGIPAFGIFGDAGYYIDAGTAYVRGALPNSINPEHPPLAKYIIGVFAVYFGNPYLASYVLGTSTGIVAFFLARQLVVRKEWAGVAVWLFAFDLISVSTFLYPVLEGFMLFFALTSAYTLLRATRSSHYLAAGILMGLALACKWSGIFFAVAELVFVLIERRYGNAVLAGVGAVVAYLATYASLIVAKGFGAFIALQLWMVGFMQVAHGPTQSLASIVGQLLLPILFHTTTYGSVTGYNWAYHPEAFSLFGRHYISFADSTNPLILLLLFPLIYWYARGWRSSQNRAGRLSLLILMSLIAWEVLFVNSLELWFFAPLTAMIAIASAGLLCEFYQGRVRNRLITYGYLAMVAAWPLVAAAIVALRVAHYWGHL